MLPFITNTITDRDWFGYNPEQSLLFNKLKSFPTFPGGCISILLATSFAIIWYQ